MENAILAPPSSIRMHHLVVVPSDRAARILTLMVAITCNSYTTVYQMIKIELQSKQQAEMDAFKEKKNIAYTCQKYNPSVILDLYKCTTFISV